MDPLFTKLLVKCCARLAASNYQLMNFSEQNDFFYVDVMKFCQDHFTSVTTILKYSLRMLVSQWSSQNQNWLVWKPCTISI